MKAAVITEKQIKAINDFFQANLPSQDLELENEVSDILRSLKPSEPVAWAATSEDGVVEALGFNKSHTRFDTPLFALDQP